MRREVRNKNNLIIGWCEDYTDIIQAIHIRKGFVGRYVKPSNITFDKRGKIYCYGDGTASLIREEENN